MASADDSDETEPELDVPYWLKSSAEAASAGFWRMLRRLPSLLAQAWRLAWESSPRITLAVVFLQLAGGAVGAVGLVSVVGVLDGLLAAGPTPERVRAAIPSVLVFAGASAARTLLSSAATAAHGRLSPLVSRAAELRLLELTTRADLAVFDDAAWRDTMYRARDRGTFASQSLVDQAITLGTNVISLVAAAGVLAVLHPVLLPLLVLAVVPTAWAAVRSARLGYRQRLRLTSLYRRRYMLSDLLADRDAAPELRAFTLREFLLAEVRRLLDAETRAHIRVMERQVWTTLLGTALGAAATGVTYAVMIWLLMTGRMELAVGGAAAYAIGTGIGALSQVAFTVRHLYEEGLYFADYQAFCALAREHAEPERARAAPRGFEELRLENVSFRYPGADKLAVDRVSLTVKRGQTVALVGENGSGKSTLAKILAGLYRPESGTVSWDGVVLDDYRTDSVREGVAVVMQEPTHWPLTARENITIGRYDRRAGPEDVERAARAGDAHEFIVELPRKYGTLLSRHFTDGVDLSGGQWQRLAVSRAFFRDASLLICDEPTANLDARAEHDVYQRLRELAEGRTVVLITHRLASVRNADLILVFDHGALAEQGDHDELMARAGRYAELFTLQAEAYSRRS
ncbi:ABC transporter ATP-binding protein [Catenuloplanes indicus]|uniref:ATP-binding cassette subfamily B protein n=1 Tax=Catenuloplanes indicus TaxID=137267 RepID=A0AAE3VYG8_9ACTN|nr:ABC transporter ATP-binding protein [Catenuloplanes indicus]MDQ0365937.1 ATP-binding cassette subfamily B protein [Catenuloplanes indicus]